MTPFALLSSSSRVRAGHLGDETDERLVALAMRGSEAAFAAIVARYRIPLTRYCARIAPGAQAEDAAQDTFVKALGALGRGERVLNLGGGTPGGGFAQPRHPTRGHGSPCRAPCAGDTRPGAPPGTPPTAPGARRAPPPSAGGS